MSKIKIMIDQVKLVDIKELKANPNNRNEHGDDQIEELGYSFKKNDFRTPIIVSNQTGLIVAGHGRYYAALREGMTHVPVSFQDFEENQEYQFAIADNALSAWSMLDKASIDEDILKNNTLDVRALGIKNTLLFEQDKKKEIFEELNEKSMQIDEKSNYIVLLFNNKNDFEIAVQKLEIKKQIYNSSRGMSEGMNQLGLGRIIDGKKILEKI